MRVEVWELKCSKIYYTMFMRICQQQIMSQFVDLGKLWQSYLLFFSVNMSFSAIGEYSTRRSMTEVDVIEYWQLAVIHDFTPGIFVFFSICI